MSEQEKMKEGRSAMAVEKPVSRHKQPYRPTDLTDAPPDLPQKRSRAPAVPSVAEDLKNLTTEETPTAENDIKEKMESEANSEKFKPNLAQKLSSNTRRGSTSEKIPLAPINIECRVQKEFTTPPHPIPATVESVPSISGIKAQKEKVEKTGKAEKQAEEDSITEEITELRTATEKQSEWSYDEEAGGLPRSESRASRVSRAVRQLFCCGVPYQAPSEDNIAEPYTMSESRTLKKVTGSVKVEQSLTNQKREVSWINDDYLEKVHVKVKTKSFTVPLERKASVGPCKSKTLYEGPSGIAICVPRKSSSKKMMITPAYSGINITIPKKSLPYNSVTAIDQYKPKQKLKENRAIKVDPEIPYLKLLAALKDQYGIICFKIKSVLHI